LVWLFIFIYYIIGQILYARLPILKSASTALIGTALAAVPIGGWTMNLLLGIDPAWCWLITSVIGAVLCVDATVRLNSRPLVAGCCACAAGLVLRCNAAIWMFDDCGCIFF